MIYQLSPISRKWVGLLFIIIISCFLFTGCARNKVIIREVQSNFSYHQSQENILNSRELSYFSWQVIRKYGVKKIFKKDPSEAIETLDGRVCSDHDRDIIFTLAEMSFYTGKKLETKNPSQAFDYYIGTVRYAYFYLFDTTYGELPNQYDPRFRLACDLYNHGLAKCFKYSNLRTLFNDQLQVSLADRKMNIKIERYGFLWGGEDFGHFRLASDFKLKGIDNPYQTFGLGVPLIAESTTGYSDQGVRRYYPPNPSFPVTAFLRVRGSICDPNSPDENMVMELYDPLRLTKTQVNGIEVPLESDLSTPLGYYLNRGKEIDRLSLVGFFHIDRVQNISGLYMLQPYQRGKIPVVMVHGLLSTPAAWLQVFNELRGDPAIRDKYQFFFYLYPTGYPFIYSASELRESLIQARNTFDPYGTDTAFDQMVLIGHSMGGLMAKLMVQESGNHVWDSISPKPVSDIQADEEALQLINKVYFFKPMPFVKRVVFIATPHRGSSFTENPIGRFAATLVKLPTDVVQAYSALLLQNPDLLGPRPPRKLPNSVDALSPNNKEIKALDKIPISQSVKYHSIIGNVKDNEPWNWTDGYVPYSSAHIEGAESEIIIPVDHRCLKNPLVIMEIKRILKEHARLNQDLFGVQESSQWMPVTTNRN